MVLSIKRVICDAHMHRRNTTGLTRANKLLLSSFLLLGLLVCLFYSCTPVRHISLFNDTSVHHHNNTTPPNPTTLTSSVTQEEAEQAY